MRKKTAAERAKAKKAREKARKKPGAAKRAKAAKKAVKTLGPAALKRRAKKAAKTRKRRYG